MARWLIAGIVLVALTVSAGACAQAADPLRTRNLNPPVAIFALPSWQPRRAGVVAGLTTEIANHYRLSQRGSDYLLLDGETLRFNFFVEKSIGSLWSVGVELPYVRQHGGVLDDTIDVWHSIFGLPDGGRNARPEDAIDFRLGQGPQQMIALDRDASGVGDVVLSAARALGRSGGYTLRLGVKLATGDEPIFAGSGATDWMATVLGARTLTLRRRDAGVYWGAGLIVPGKPSLIGLPGEDVVATALAGGSLSFRERLGVKAQLEVHTPFYETPLEELGQTSVQLSLGGWWAFADRARFDFAVSEDLHVSTAPDVTLHAGLQWLW